MEGEQLRHEGEGLARCNCAHPAGEHAHDSEDEGTTLICITISLIETITTKAERSNWPQIHL
jgi:hypothetical protein